MIRAFAEGLIEIHRGGDRMKVLESLQAALREAEGESLISEGELAALRGVLESIKGKWSSSLPSKLIASADDPDLLRLLQARLRSWPEDITELTTREKEYLTLWSELISELLLVLEASDQVIQAGETSQ